MTPSKGGNQTAGDGGTVVGGSTDGTMRINSTASGSAEGGDLQPRIIIITFSFTALGAVSVMLYWRLKEAAVEGDDYFLVFCRTRWN